jgi:hypothetical protein
MSVTPTTMLPLGTRAPGFSLVNAIDGRTTSLGCDIEWNVGNEPDYFR